MKIALIGAPGSGKTSLAKAIYDDMESAAVIDEYVEGLERYTGYVFGNLATYIGNLYIATHRWAEEQEARRYEHIITCGTIIETCVYNAMNSKDRERTWGRRIPAILRRDASMDTLGLMFADTWDYDIAFHLSPRNSDHPELAGFIQEAVKNFNPPHLHHLTGTDEERLEAAREALTAAEAV